MTWEGTATHQTFASEKKNAATSDDEADAEVVEHILASRSRASLDVGSPVEQGIETARSVL